MIMENASYIVLFWDFFIVIFAIMITLILISIILINKSKKQSVPKIKLLGRICLVLGIMCAIPIFLVVGYVMYLYLG